MAVNSLISSIFQDPLTPNQSSMMTSSSSEKDRFNQASALVSQVVTGHESYWANVINPASFNSASLRGAGSSTVRGSAPVFGADSLDYSASSMRVKRSESDEIKELAATLQADVEASSFNDSSIALEGSVTNQVEGLFPVLEAKVDSPRIIDQDLSSEDSFSSSEKPLSESSLETKQGTSVKGQDAKRYACEESQCGKVYTTRHHLITHMRVHTGERPYICNWDGCEDSFRRGDELSRHILVHTGKRNFRCGHCVKSFKRADHVKAHLNTHVNKSNKNSFSFRVLQNDEIKTYKLV